MKFDEESLRTLEECLERNRDVARKSDRKHERDRQNLEDSNNDVYYAIDRLGGLAKAVAILDAHPMDILEWIGLARIRDPKIAEKVAKLTGYSVDSLTRWPDWREW